MSADRSNETNVFGARPFWPLALGKRDALPLAKLFERRSDEAGTVEENVPTGRHRDEPESLVRYLLDRTVGHVMLL
jgi:hypothetical protein